MFVTKKYHQSCIRNFEAQMHILINGHLAETLALKNQIEDLRKLVFIPRQEPHKELFEADSVISASEKPPEMSEEERNAMLEGIRELDLIVSGNYDQELLN